MKDNHEVWIGAEDLTQDESYIKSGEQEFFELPIAEALSKEEAAIEKATSNASRRDFLKYVGFSLTAATVASACEAPLRKAIPYVSKPDAIVPGVATYYASTFVQGGDICPILVKTRDGRPIKIEGNPGSKMTLGGTSARAQASVLSLYDTNRLEVPGQVSDGKASEMNWEEFDKEIAGKLNAGSSIRIVSHTILSPTLKKAIQDFRNKYPQTKVVQYDPVSASGLLDANNKSFGLRAVPSYKFQNANVIVGFDCDFLGTWISPIEYAAQYAQNRNLESIQAGTRSHHVQVESGMSLTGSNADNRILVKPSEQGAAILALYNAVAGATGGASAGGTPTFSNKKAAKALANLGKRLAENRGRSLVVSGSNDINQQILVNGINAMLGSYGATIDWSRPSNQRQGKDADIQGLISEMSGVDAVIVMGGANPAYDIPNADKFAEALSKVKVSISMNPSLDETASVCKYVAPDHHYLESWGDAEAKAGEYSLIQPTIAPLFKTRSAGESLLIWAGSASLDKNAEQPYYEYLKSNWQAGMFGGQSKYASFRGFWDNALHDGLLTTYGGGAGAGAFSGDVSGAASAIKTGAAGEVEINFYETVNLGDGHHANNPWLMEMPDPVNRCAWQNYLSVPVKWDGVNDYNGFNGLKDGDLVTVAVNGVEYTVPVIRQFGQMEGTVSLALGYGRTSAGKVGNKAGVDVYKMMKATPGGTQYHGVASVSNKKGTVESFACIQYHHTYGVTGPDQEDGGKTINVDEKVLGHKGYQGSLTGRSVMYTTNIKDLKKFEGELKHKREHAQHLNSKTLYPFDEYTEKFYSQGHHWGMSVDMNACIGCGACQVACIAENNVPVVGEFEVSRHHEMTWMRIDRYYYGDVENPNTVYQPMMCQHCDNAPCENVCPVSATNHSSEGLNQMTYNRCIGTRYCANNCPYKVRRFNWKDYMTADLFPVNEVDLNRFRTDEPAYYMQDNLERMVLNPDVTVRSRGVIEKCSFCVQRIQEGKLTAKKEGRRLGDNDVKTACQTACPTGAIVFGDQNNKASRIAERNASSLNYYVLEEVNTQSSVGYIAKVNSRDEDLDA